MIRVGAVLSLTGPFARFGRQAAAGLAAWERLTAGVEVVIEDDGGEPDGARAGLRRLALRCDLLLGPYATGLARAAAGIAADADLLLWNHGGSGDDVQAAAPGHVVSVLTPTSRYAESFVQLLAARPDRLPLWLVTGPGGFGRQVLDGAQAVATAAGLPVVRGGTPPPGPYDLISAGRFEDDVAAAAAALSGPVPPRMVLSVAAGVRDGGALLRSAAGDPPSASGPTPADHPAGRSGPGRSGPGQLHGTAQLFGTAQWWPGASGAVEVGPAEAGFLVAHAAVDRRPPDYPAVQAAAGAALAVHCARIAGGVGRAELWRAATGLRTTTMFGDFAVDPVTGAQTGHRMTMVRWTAAGPVPETVGPPP